MTGKKERKRGWKKGRKRKKIRKEKQRARERKCVYDIYTDKEGEKNIGSKEKKRKRGREGKEEKKILAIFHTCLSSKWP